MSAPQTTADRGVPECTGCRNSGVPVRNTAGVWVHVAGAVSYGPCAAQDIWNTDGLGATLDERTTIDLEALAIRLYGHAVNRTPDVTARELLQRIANDIVNALPDISVAEIERRAKGDLS